MDNFRAEEFALLLFPAQDDGDPAVLLTAFHGVVGGHRTCLAKASRRDLFRANAALDDEIDEIESVAAEVGKTLRGKILVVLENGQIWRQIDGDSSSPYIPRDGAGLPVTIKKGAFGSYFVKVGKARDTFKARRIK